MYSDYFHDVRAIHKKGLAALAAHVESLWIHILVDWDGYCRNGIRLQGLYALRPSPVQIMHQEFLSTSGGNFDYIVTDKTVSPLQEEKFYICCEYDDIG